MPKEHEKLDIIQEAHEKLQIRLKVHGNRTAIVDLIYAVAKYQRGLKFWEPIVSKKDIEMFLDDPKTLRAQGANKMGIAGYVNIIAIASAICSVCNVLCPYVEDLTQ